MNSQPNSPNRRGQWFEQARRVLLASLTIYQGFSFQPRMKPIPKHQSAATSGFSRAYSLKYSMKSLPTSNVSWRSSGV